MHSRITVMKKSKTTSKIFKEHYYKRQCSQLIKKDYLTPEDCWSIEVDTAKFLVPRLKLFLKTIDHCGATPGILALQYPDDCYERWVEIINKMLFAFEYYADLYERRFNTNDEEQAKINEGLMLFAEYYGYLWV